MGSCPSTTRGWSGGGPRLNRRHAVAAGCADHLSQRARRQFLSGNPRSVSSTSPSPNLAGRLADVKKNGQAFATYTYDANGNRLTGGATYDEEDRQLTGNGASFTYTPNGERKTRVDAAGTTTYGYDGRGHLISVQLPTGKSVKYGVDARGRRVSRSENGVVSHRWLFRNQLQPVAEVDASGEVTTRYVYGTRVNVPDYFVRAGTTYAVLTDHLGSVRKVVDTASGEVVQELDYDPWGVVTKDTSPGFQPFGFAGGVWDAATKLVHFGAREYEAGTGRWTRRDPIGFGGGTRASLRMRGAIPWARSIHRGRRLFRLLSRGGSTTGTTAREAALSERRGQLVCHLGRAQRSSA